MRKKVDEEKLSILSSIRNEIQENWDNTYMNAKSNPGKVFQGVYTINDLSGVGVGVVGVGVYHK